MNEITNFRGETAPPPGEDAVGTEAAASALIARVGERVRAARERKGLSRRVLSEKSGVSQRYLAQLETAGGNISIGLLVRVAMALDFRIEWLVGEDDPWTSETLRLADMLRSATAEQRRAVRALLSPEPAGHRRAQRVALIGLRGAGKSSLGARMGTEFGVPFVELNAEIEAQSGMPVSEVLAFYGQEGYRKLEAQALGRVIATHEAAILAVAGGIVAEPETYNLLLERFHTIWLRARPEDHMARVRAQGDERPMAGNPAAMEDLRSILTSREALYRRAEAALETSERGFEATAEALAALIRAQGFLG